MIKQEPNMQGVEIHILFYIPEKYKAKNGPKLNLALHNLDLPIIYTT